MRLLVALALALSLLAVAATAAQADDKECGPAPKVMASKPSLPARFPTPANVRYTKARKAGPTTIVSGFWRNGDLDAAHGRYVKAFKAANYTVTHDELEQDDSEVNFAGAKKSGQVKLEKDCETRVTVTITIRPA